MKIVYSELKKLLPNLTADYQQLRDDLTLIGHFASGFIKTENDQIYDLEIRQNRGDCQGYYGIAKDLSVFYNIPLETIKSPLLQGEGSAKHLGILPIQINSSDVKRILAVSIDNIVVKDSPKWLIDFLAYHEVNTINNIVDATNYIMLLYGIPCHAFDIHKTSLNLIWENNNNKFKNFTTLDGTTLKLEADNLIISNQNEPLSLSFIGGQNSGIGLDTHSTILEMAVYNRSRVRKDSRSLKTITEASIRLDKDLDTETIPLAFNHLIQLILELSHGQISSQVFENYAIHSNLEKIEFNPNSPSQFSGINIPSDFAIDCLKRLDCQIEKQNENSYLITPPSIRKDISLTEDLIEEVIRFWGYNKIPLDMPISSEKLPDIAPPVLHLIDSIQNILIELGYDEVRSWPLIKESSLLPKLAPTGQKPIYTQNSINSEFPVLRQSIISSLIQQQDQYARYKVPQNCFFEIGKIFYQENNQYQEKYSLGLFNMSEEKLKQDIEHLFTKLEIPAPQIIRFCGSFIEIYLDEISHLDFKKIEQSVSINSAYELTSQIITLDANITLDQEENSTDLINKYSQIIGDKYLWQLIITDSYHDIKINKYRYTFRASYFNTDDKTAKALHLKSFDLV